MAGDVGVVLVAAGRGLRAGGDRPKQYVAVGGVPIVRRSLEAFATHPAIGWVQTVIHPDDAALFDDAARGLSILPAVKGEATRQGSVRAGLEALAPHKPAVVLIHDAARPFVDAETIARVIDAARARGAALPVLPLADTVKTVDAADHVTGTIDRSQLRLAQTPQGFRFAEILAAHRRAAEAQRADFTDDAAIAEWAGLTVATVAGHQDNIKITTPADIAQAQERLTMDLDDIRTATGYDVHAFAEGDHVMIGGVKIAHGRGLSGHSDADVALHALVDAVLGAIADGDIGAHFPPSDPQWRGASSDRFLAFAVERVKARGGRIAHLDVTIVCEAPRIGPHREAIRARIAEIAGVALGRVSVKATTSEKLGFTGRQEGIAALATATVRLPEGDA